MKPRTLFLLLVTSALLWLPIKHVRGQQPIPEDATGGSDSSACKGTLFDGPKLRGEGEAREMLVCGRVLDLDGAPARDFELVVKLNKHRFGGAVLPTKIAGNAFEVWIPIGGLGGRSVELAATSTNGSSRVFVGIAQQELRKAAIEGIELRLSPVDRNVEVAVMHKGAPVANAHVIARLSGNMLLESTTDENGKSLLRLGDGEKLSQLTAWTDNFRIGGFSFNRQPRRDPLGTTFSIALDDCRDQMIRLVNDKGLPVPGLPFELTIGTGAPNFNFAAVPATCPHCCMTTDKDGDATFRWFPDWESHGAYVEIFDRLWAKATDNDGIETGDKGELVVTLKQRVPRKPMVGRIVSDQFARGGFLVEIKSFQGEEPGYSDYVYAFTDETGSFTADIIPGAAYTVCINDGQLVSNMIDLVPYEPKTGKSNSAELTVSEGRQVEVRVTSGSSRQPMRNKTVYVRQIHRYKWIEDGEERSGQGARDYPVFTDDHGIARAIAPAGADLRITVYADEWRSDDRELTVKEDGSTLVEFHREVDEQREVRGRLLPPANVAASVAGAEIVFGSIDSETHERQTIAADAEGRFSFKTKAIRLGIFAYTTDGKAAAIARPERLDDLIEFHLNPTAHLHGQLLGRDNQPLAHHVVRANAQVRGKPDFNRSLPTGFDAKAFETKTDEQGNYTLENLPSELDMTLRADPIDDAETDVNLDSFYVVAGEERPRMVSRLSREAEVDDRELAAKCDATVRAAKLDNYHVLVLSYDSMSMEFVGTKLLNRDQVPEVSSFLNLNITEDSITKEADRKFADSRHWPPPKQGKVFACVLNGTGEELGRIEIDIDSVDAAGAGAEFLRRYAPPQADAKLKWDAAFAEARRTDRRVWARIGQRYCGPCFLFSRWLDDNHELLERDYVLLKVDDVRDKHGVEIAKQIAAGRERYSIPFHTIFDADGDVLIDSESAEGNIGYPSTFEGRRHIDKMLRETHDRLSDAELDGILKTLDE